MRTHTITYHCGTCHREHVLTATEACPKCRAARQTLPTCPTCTPPAWPKPTEPPA